MGNGYWNSIMLYIFYKLLTNNDGKYIIWMDSQDGSPELPVVPRVWRRNGSR